MKSNQSGESPYNNCIQISKLELSVVRIANAIDLFRVGYCSKIIFNVCLIMKGKFSLSYS